MIALTRFFLLGSAYFVMLTLSDIASAEWQSFSMVTFLITSICIGGWLYLLAQHRRRSFKRIKGNALCCFIFNNFYNYMGGI